MKLTPQAVCVPIADESSEYLKSIEKAITVLQEDSQINYDVLL